ncbi:Kynurenine formamidase [Parasphingorhabdus marina DSM 22363]|uniref:Kynurenine formamidase n=1 Tax=Parasphingorhabdus marina DSM 22363 TaxID=1123272 RepID=A0A1N6FDU5_9SPHN|nr:cyclase family protein [Parasphingorhabdus marina]SIN93386.1 Kynurenine formamidase [Parasphingorhabdus marina DSM 22363]
MRIIQIITFLSVGTLVSCGAPVPQPFDPSSGKWVDLSHSYGAETIYWPTSDKFALETVSEGDTDGGYYYSAYKFTTAEHGGTHLDAPVHFARGKHSTENIPISSLTGPAAVIDVSDVVQDNADYQIGVADIARWEALHGPVPAGAQVLFHTGWAARWPDAKRYLGTDERGAAATAKLRFPGLSPEAATFLAEERQIESVGLDTASLDFGRSTGFEAHRILMEKNIIGYENVTGLEQLPPIGAYLVALPMKIEGGSGGPLRIVAFVPSAAETVGQN